MLCVIAIVISACSAPCGTPGRLCAPITSVASAPPAAAPARPAPPPAEKPVEVQVQTFAVPMPGDAAPPSAMQITTSPSPAQQGPSVRIGLLLPLRSDTLGRAADAVRAGFKAAWERDNRGFDVTVIETGDTPQDVLAAFTTAQAQQDMIVGPLARSAVSAIAASALIEKPVIALNHPEQAPASTNMLVMGLSIEDEARQVADWAARDNPGAGALIVAGNSAWQRRIAAAFSARWQRLGMRSESVELNPLNGYLQDADLVALRARLQEKPSGVVFAALDPDQARQLHLALAAPPLENIPLYGTSSLNPGRSLWQPGSGLDGVRLLDLPWMLQRDHPAVMSYPQLEPRGEERVTPDMERLYALGIDAFRIARELAQRRGQRFRLDGVTGQLTVDFGTGPAWFERAEVPAEYQNGVPVPVAR